MTAKRVAAVVIAVVLVVAALLIRNGLDDNSSSATQGSDKPSNGKVTVICSTEFEAICDALDSKKYAVRTESAGDTLDQLAKAGAVLPDAWITLDPFPGMIDEMRRVNSVTATNPTVSVIATDSPMLAVAKALLGPVETLCGATVSWKCIGTEAGEPLAGGGTMRPGITDPDSEAGGLVSFANAVAGYFNNVTSDPSLWSDPQFVKWHRSFHSSAKVTVSEAGEAPLSTLILRKTLVNVAATTSVEIKNSKQPGAFTAFPINPAIDYSAVVATFTNRAGDLAAKVTASLVTAGWAQASDHQPTLPAGTFVALRRLWEGK